MLARDQDVNLYALPGIQVADMARICLDSVFQRELDREGRLKVPWTNLVAFLKEHHHLSPSKMLLALQGVQQTVGEGAHQYINRCEELRLAAEVPGAEVVLHVIRGLNEASRVLLDTRLEAKYGDTSANLTRDEALRLVKYDDLRLALMKESVTAAVERGPTPASGGSRPAPSKPAAKACLVGMTGPTQNSVTPRLDIE